MNEHECPSGFVSLRLARSRYQRLNEARRRKGRQHRAEWAILKSRFHDIRDSDATYNGTLRGGHCVYYSRRKEDGDVTRALRDSSPFQPCLYTPSRTGQTIEAVAMHSLTLSGFALAPRLDGYAVISGPPYHRPFHVNLPTINQCSRDQYVPHWHVTHTAHEDRGDQWSTEVIIIYGRTRGTLGSHTCQKSVSDGRPLPS